MGEIDRKRVAAVRVLEAMGHRFDGTNWQLPIDPAPWPEADRVHALLMDRAEVLSGSIEDTKEDDELRAIADALEAYEAKRWPKGRVAGGKG